MTDVLEDDFAAQILSLIASSVPRRARKAGLRGDMQLQRDLGFDSLGLAALVFRIESAFAVDLSTIDLGARMAAVRTVGDVVAMSRTIIGEARGLAPR